MCMKSNSYWQITCFRMHNGLILQSFISPWKSITRVKSLQHYILWGVVVYWSIHSTLTLRTRVRLSPSPRHFCPSARQFIHIAALDPGVFKWGPGRMWQIIVFEIASAIITGCYTRQWMLPGEWKLCTVSAALKSIQWSG